MNMPGYVCICMEIYGYGQLQSSCICKRHPVWTCMDMSMDLCEYEWMCMDMYEYVQICLNMYE